MKNQITPAPWQISVEKTGHFIQSPDDKLNGGWIIASAVGHDAESNAALICEAPKMLALLHKLMAHPKNAINTNTDVARVYADLPTLSEIARITAQFPI